MTKDLESARTILSQPRPEYQLDDGVVPTINGYEILSELGRGAMGIVYEATQVSLSRTVALKMIMSANATGEELARFVSEAEAVAHLQHPNIVQIYQIGECLGRPFFSLEFVEGGDLERKLKERPLAWRDAAKMVSVIARAIHVAHEKGIVHRDLKPANILLASDGTPKITDFGIAKRLDASNQTQDGKIIGSPSYMAPEQATGRNDLVGPRTDIYALGAILYNMLAGRPPFECDNTMDTLLQTIVGEVVPPRLLQPKLPSDLNVICLKCLEKEPDRRYETALELSRDLDRLLAGEAIHARPIGQVEKAQRWVRRHPAWGTLILASVLGLITLAVMGAWFTSKLQKELRATERARKDATDARNEIRLRLVRSAAATIDSDLRLLSQIPQVIASALELRRDWSEQQLEQWLRSEIATEPQLFGIAVAFEAREFKATVNDYCLYAFQNEGTVQVTTLLPPEYTPLYREWSWYRNAVREGAWSEPYVDDGGGEVPMTTYSLPFYREGKKAGVVTADLSLEYFRALQNSVKKSSFGGSSYAFVATSQGTIVSHPLNEFRFPASKGKLPGEIETGLWSRVLKGELGSESGFDLVTGKPAELLFGKVKMAGWTFVSVLPQ